MNTIIKSILALTLCLTAACSGSTEQTDREKFLAEYEEIKAKALSTSGPGHPALWKMGDADTTIYLFGTVHLLPNDLEWQNPVITEAFDASERVLFEVNLESLEAMQTFATLTKENGYLPKGENIYDKMEPEEAEKVKIALKGIGYNPDAISNLKPWNASMNIYQDLLIQEGYNPLKGVESVFKERAYKQGMSFGYLETIEEQFAAISGASFEDQLEELIEGVEYLDMTSEVLDDMLNEWVDGDVKGLGIMAASPETMGESDESYERILVNRNRNWIPNIEAILDDPGTNFIAVGAAHLAGPDSVILMLEEKGYEVERIQ